jgi:rare lipoprotein A (peptidoglycan hydrolase)
MKKIVGAIIFVAFALGGCSTTVTEKANDKLCTGTKRPYKVMGSWYTPQEHYNYKEEGVASWYGPRFHGKPKSCGEIFNMHGVSAAHKTLPIPSVVRVTNVRNGTSVKLLVDDRGPFVDDRIIDLSKGAATYLGICSQGLGKVCVECLPEDSKAFARFVAQYGRYGRDPSGRTWEAIFREKFDTDGCIPTPGYPVPDSKRSMPKRPSPTVAGSFKGNAPFRRHAAKPIPVSNRSYKKSKDVDKRGDIDRLLEVRAS